MRVQFTRGRVILLAALLATALGAPAVMFALPADAPDLNIPPHAGAAPGWSVWDQAAPAPVVTVRPPPETKPAAPERALSANPLWEIPLSSLSITRERPIFSLSRRPPPAIAAVAKPIAPPVKPPQDERPPLTLVGTIGGDRESFGIFIDQTNNAGLRLRIGEDFQGWKLRSVQRREVTLERSQKKTILSLPQPETGAMTTPRSQAESMAAQRPSGVPSQPDPPR